MLESLQDDKAMFIAHTCMVSASFVPSLLAIHAELTQA